MKETKNLILCGLPMSGKTTVGKKLAAKLEWPFIDTDQLIEETYALQTGKIFSCRQIFRAEGEAAFRLLEKQQIASLKQAHPYVIAVGGGSCQDKENVAHLQSIGLLIYLKTPAQLLWERVKTKGIPAYLDPVNPEQDFYKIVEKRLPAYAAAAVTVEAGYLNEEQVVEAILHKRNQYGE